MAYPKKNSKIRNEPTSASKETLVKGEVGIANTYRTENVVAHALSLEVAEKDHLVIVERVYHLDYILREKERWGGQ